MLKFNPGIALISLRTIESLSSVTEQVMRMRHVPRKEALISRGGGPGSMNVKIISTHKNDFATLI